MSRDYPYLIVAALIVSSVSTTIAANRIESRKTDSLETPRRIWKWNPIYALQMLVKNGSLNTKERILLLIPLTFFLLATVLAIMN